MKLVCFPWAGGSSALYAPWLKHPTITHAFSAIICVDYPCRASRMDQEPIGKCNLSLSLQFIWKHNLTVIVFTSHPLQNYIFAGNIDPLVDDILEHYECFGDNNTEEIVLFGHSFGAIVVFEVAKRLEERGDKRVKAVFVSASGK